MTRIIHLIPSLDTPQGLHERRLAKELRILARGRADGAKNYPASEETQQTEIELSILTHRCSRRSTSSGQWLTRRLKDIAKAVSDRAPSEVERDYASPIEEARFEIARLRDERRDDLAASCDARCACGSASCATSSARTGSPIAPRAYPPKIVRVWRGRFCSSSVASRAWRTSRSLRTISDFGGAGGAARRLSFALGNFFIGFVVIGALGLRYAGHVRLRQAARRRLAILLGGGGGRVYNAYIAEYREVLRLGTGRAADGTDPGGPASPDVWTGMVADPTGFLNTDQGPLLFLIGMRSASSSSPSRAMLLYSDRYPGYKPVDKAFREQPRPTSSDAKLEFRDAASADRGRAGSG
jgi:hypothetical protein